MRIPFVRRAASLLRTLRGPMLFRRMARSAVDAQPTAAPAMIVAPHADDETFGCGGIIAFKRQQNASVTIVILTDGTASHPTRPPAEVTEERQAEALAATAALGVPASAVIFLDAPDGRLDSLAPDRRSAMVRRLADLLIEKRPAELYIPHRHDRHPDHEAASILARESLALAGSAAIVTVLEYPIWLLWWAPLNQPARQMHLGRARRMWLNPAALAQKSAAIAVYRSQLPGMPWKFMRQFTAGFELFFTGDMR